MRAFVFQVWAELVQTLRTKEIWYFLLGPAAVGVPTVIGLGQLAVTALPIAMVALPPNLPLDLSEMLEEESLVALEVDDVRRAVEEGEAMWGILALEELDGTEGTRWRAEILARGGEDTIRRVVDGAAWNDFKERVASAGGSRRDWRPAWVRIQKSSSSAGVPAAVKQIMKGWLVTTLTLVALVVLPLQVIADRQAGVLESLAATPSVLVANWLSRAVAMALVQMLAALCFVGSTMGIMLAVEAPPPVDIWQLPIVFLVVVLIDCWLVGIGYWAPTVVSAMNTSLGVMVMLAISVFYPLPWWAPMFGLLGAQGWEIGASIAISLVFCGVALVVATRFLPERRLYPEQGGRK